MISDHRRVPKSAPVFRAGPHAAIIRFLSETTIAEYHRPERGAPPQIPPHGMDPYLITRVYPVLVHGKAGVHLIYIERTLYVAFAQEIADAAWRGLIDARHLVDHAWEISKNQDTWTVRCIGRARTPTPPMPETGWAGFREGEV